MLSYIYIFVILSFYLISFPMSVFGEGNNPKEVVNYIDLVIAQEYELNDHNDIAQKLNYYGLWSKKGRLYKSDKVDLKAFLSYEAGDSTIRIEWKKSMLKIPLKGQTSFIKWRPMSNCFIYPFDAGSEGDFGTMSLHYVCLSHVNGKIDLNDAEISSHQLSTDLGWSSDGKYYAYSKASSLRIKNFETGKVWATKLILLNTKTEEIKIPENNPNQLGGFIWRENNTKLLFFWKKHPFDDAPVGAAVINIDQFKLE